MALPSNVELILMKWLGEDVQVKKPQSRVEALLMELMESGGGGATPEEIQHIVDVEIAKVVAEAPEDFDTLIEIADWIEHHEDDAAAMNSAIQANTRSITALQTAIANVYNKTESDTRYEPKTVTLTQAQYDALTPAEKSNGTIYFISDGGSSSSGAGYSLTTLYESEFDLFSVGDTISLPNDIDTYDEIRFYSATNDTESGYIAHVGRGVIDKSMVLWSLDESQISGTFRGFIDVLCSYAESYSISWAITLPNKKTILCKQKQSGRWSADKCGLIKIVGVKYGGGQ